METIYVRLLDESVDVWRPVTAIKQSAGSYQIEAQPVPEGESWEFAPGEVVMCERDLLDDDKQALVAVHRVTEGA